MSFYNFLFSLFYFYIMKYLFSFRVKLRNAYGTDWRNAARHTIAAVWDAHGWIWHGIFH